MALNDQSKGFAGALALMATVATGMFIDHEGEKLRAYRDVVGVWTICSGDTRNVTPGLVETEEGCLERTENIMEEYGEAVAKENPDIVGYPFEWGAHTSFAANVGVAAYRKSSINRLYKAGEHRKACRFLTRYNKAGGRVFPGLNNRRQGTNEKIGEYEMCLVDAIPRDLAND